MGLWKRRRRGARGGWLLGALGLLSGLSSTARADWREAVGEADLALFLNAALPSDGSGVVVGLVEATSGGLNNYLPQDPTTATNTFIGTGNFAGKSFTQVSGTGIKSNHAATVGAYFLGLSGSLAPGVVTVANQSAGSFIYSTLGTPYIDAEAPIPELEDPRQIPGTPEQVQSHAYVGTADALDPTEFADMAARFDFQIAESSVLAIVGLNNGSNSTTPPLWNSAYNVVSVGLSSGAHSSGDTASGFVGAGRVKPDLVAPLTATSWSTGAVASAGAYLHGVIDALTLDPLARQPEALKAILLAGASKDPFPDWNNDTQPLDSHYGAGELDLVATQRILTANRQPGLATTGASVAGRGWDRNAVSDAAPIVYDLDIPDEGLGAELSVALCWLRTVQEDVAGGGPKATYTYLPDPVADLALELHDANGLVERSDSALDNVEHLYHRRLAPGSYQLKVFAATGMSADYGLAWRVEPQLSPSMQIAEGVDSTQFDLSALKSDHRYWLQRSENNTDWTNIEAIEESTTTHSTADDAPPGAGDIPVFYRLQWFSP